MHILQLVLLLATIRADLPVHCERGDYIGLWRFRLVGHPQKFPLDLSSGSKFCSATLGQPTQNSDLLRQLDSATDQLRGQGGGVGGGEEVEVYFTDTQDVDPELPDYSRHRLLAISP